MQDDAILAIPTPGRSPWNRRLIGTEGPLRQEAHLGDSHHAPS